MTWIFIVVRDNVVEDCKVFTDYFLGEQFANDFIKKIDPSADLPRYREGEVYSKDSLRVGLYKDAQI